MTDESFCCAKAYTHTSTRTPGSTLPSPNCPPKEAFFSNLSDQHICEDDYARAQRMWETFGCCNLGDYHDFYNRINVLLLADVIETFRKTSRQQCGLDPAHYYTSPGFSWDSLLKRTGAELKLLTDYDQHLFIEKGMRGGYLHGLKALCPE